MRKPSFDPKAQMKSLLGLTLSRAEVQASAKFENMPIDCHFHPPEYFSLINQVMSSILRQRQLCR